jgi:hypothetical protein
MAKPRTTEERLRESITWFRERNILTTRANIKSVANRFAVRWQDLSFAVECEARMKGEEIARLSRSKKPNRLSGN